MNETALYSRVINAGQYQRERWRNGQGWTCEILRVPADGEWQYRLSIAEIESDSAFSTFDGVDRELVLLQGHGLRLVFDSGDVVEMLPPHAQRRFAGEQRIDGELIDGPSTDFNLMWQRDAWQAELLRRPLVGTMLFFADAVTTWAIHLLAGQAWFDDDSGLPPMAAGDTAFLCESARRRFMLRGAGELLVIRLWPRGTESPA